MKKVHSPIEPQAFERLMLLIATLIKYPGVGYQNYDPLFTSNDSSHYDALQEVQEKMQELAKILSIYLPAGYPSLPTIRKDLEKLRNYHILEQRMYRWGYYLGTGVMSKEELKIAFDALSSQAIYQGDPRIRAIHRKLTKRLKGFQIESNPDFFYPVRQNLNRAINHTDPEEMIAKKQNRNTLFHQIDKIESAIIQGQAVEIICHTNYYDEKIIGTVVVYPLQLIYYDIAWYLLYEDCNNSGFLVVGRVNRYNNHCVIDNTRQRDIDTQRKSLEKAHQLLRNGWGLYLGNLEAQQLELAGKLEFIAVKVRFYPPISYFMQEGELRHPNQKLKQGPKNPTTGKSEYLDYCINLPPRSLNEFAIWVQRYFDKAQILSPPELVKKHHQAAQALVNLYQ